MNKNFYTLLLFLFALCTGLQGQSYLMNGTPITDCSGFFLDSGGGNGDYGPNENFTTVICPDFSSGTHIQLVFPGANIANGDQLCFFDGNSTAAPLLSCNTDLPSGGPFIMQATAANPTGCLTITFNSDGAGQDSGWGADINCIPACQTILASLAMTDPMIMPADTGWIDICPGEGISFVGAGSYPQNGTVYQHSDLTSSFSWNFGDGSTSEGPTAFHVFDEPGGYIVQMRIEDQFGCFNSNFISQRVRVSPYPSFNFADDIPAICAGDSLTLGASIGSIDSAYNVSVVSNPGSFQTSGVLSDSLFLPDGNGTCYETSIFFSDFSPGQILTNMDDFLSICVVMEHSYMGDMDIFLTCPDGTEVTLQSQGGSGTYLGEPIDNDLDLSPGLGYLYCWTPTATNGTWTQNAGGVGTLPAGDYNSFESLDNFLGCPLNGEWTIKVCDNLLIDNGYIFEWSINLSEDLYPNIETFTPIIVDWGWNPNPSIYYTSATNDSISASPQNAGTANYNFYVVNDYGCTFDTIISIPVLPPTHPDCHTCEGELQTLIDTSICDGGILMLDGEVPVGLGNQSVTFEAYSNTPFDNNTHPNANPIVSTTNVSSINPTNIIDATLQIESVCVNITHGFAGDVELFLQAPNGAILELSTDNGGSANNYTNTCFTPDAALPITAGAPPYTGDFQPEGNWAILNGSPINGNWSLLVADDVNGGPGVFIGWTITFTNENNITYTWETTTDLSCLDCPDPEVTPSAPTNTYTLETEDSFGCILNDTVEVQLLASLAAPMVICQVLPTDDIQFDWNAVAGAGGYEVSLDGGLTWVPANGALSHVVTGNLPGQTVDLLVRATNSTGCNALISNSSCTVTACNMTTDTTSTIAPTCFNTMDGFVFMESVNFAPPVVYMLDGSSPGGPTIPQVSAGFHTVVAMDGDGCLDSISFEMLAPPEITAMLVIDEVSCTGGMDGTATATGDGGVGGFNYTWNTNPTTTSGATLSNVPAGSYLVTISDANNCSIVEEAIVPDGIPLTLVMSEVPVICNGGSSGAAVATPSGGSGTYNYLWSNNQVTSTANNLIAGNYEVTVTDTNGCEVINNITVTEPPMMALNFTMDPVACFGESSGILTAIPTNAVAPITYIWSNGNSTAVNSNLAAGNYCLTISDANNCTITNCFDVTAPTELTLTGSTTPTLCANGNEGSASVVASGGTVSTGYTYVWPDGQNTPTANNLAAGDYVVTVYDDNSCQNTLSVNVAAAPSITLQMDSSPANCFNTNDGTATVTASGGTGSTFAYQWDVNANIQTSPTAINLLAGDYCVTVSDNNNCTVSECITVAAPPAIVITDAIETAISCFGSDDGQAEVMVTGGAGTTYTYLWNDPNAQSANPANMLAPGTYNVIVSDANGCTQTESVTITEPAELIASVSSNNISCFGQTNGIATATPTGGTAPYNYTWNNGQNTAIATNLSAGMQQVTITDNNGCTSVAMTTISEPASALSLSVMQTFVSCYEDDLSEATALATGGTGAYNYQWSNGLQSANANGLAAANYSVTVSDANGCTSTQAITITELTEVTINVATVEPDCFGESSGQLGVNIVNGGIGGGVESNYTFVWNSPGIPTQNTAYINGMPGGQDYSVTVSDAQGCSTTGTYFLDQPDQMMFSLNAVDVRCSGEPTGEITVSNIIVGTAPFNYQWDANTGNQNTVTATNLSTGDYFVTVTDALGCTAVNNTVVEEPAPLTMEVEIKDNVCADLSVGSASVQANGGVGNYSYLWSSGATTSAIQNLPTGQVVVTVTDGNGCMLGEIITISQPEELVGLAEGEPVSCFGDRNGRVMLEANGGTAPYLYQFDDGPLNGTSSLVGISAGTYPVLIQDVNGCQWEDEVTIGSPEEVEVYAGADPTINLGETFPLTVFTSNTIGVTDILWTAPYEGTLVCPDSTMEVCWNPISITQNTITYTVLVVDENGCEGRDDITVFVTKERPIYVPTAFTPNGDAVNNKLLVHGNEDTTIDLFRIYDRWGSLVFESRDIRINDANTGWDGTFKGKALNPGVYVWYIEASYIDGYEEVFKGQTTLIR